MVFGDTTSLMNAAGKNAAGGRKQYCIFLGRGWAADKVRTRENMLANLLSNGDLIRPDILAGLGWNNAYGAKGYMEQRVGDTGLIADLRIQSILTQVVKSDPAASLTDGTVYIIYLDPD